MFVSLNGIQFKTVNLQQLHPIRQPMIHQMMPIMKPMKVKMNTMMITIQLINRLDHQKLKPKPVVLKSNCHNALTCQQPQINRIKLSQQPAQSTRNRIKRQFDSQLYAVKSFQMVSKEKLKKNAKNIISRHRKINLAMVKQKSMLNQTLLLRLRNPLAEAQIIQRRHPMMIRNLNQLITQRAQHVATSHFHVTLFMDRMAEAKSVDRKHQPMENVK